MQTAYQYQIFTLQPSRMQGVEPTPHLLLEEFKSPHLYLRNDWLALPTQSKMLVVAARCYHSENKRIRLYCAPSNTPNDINYAAPASNLHKS